MLVYKILVRNENNMNKTQNKTNVNTSILCDLEPLIPIPRPSDLSIVY